MPTRQISLPYFILYNKYQGIVRIFVFLKFGTAYTTGTIRLWQDNAFSSTVALTFLENIALGSNELEKVQNRTSAATTPVINNRWAFADFPIAYDKTIATKSNPRIQFEIWGVDNYSINIDGLGTMTQVFGQNSPGNISNAGFFKPGGSFEALGKRVSGTQESWNKWTSIVNQIGSNIPENSSSISLRNLKTNISNLKNTWTIGSLGLIGAGVGIVDFLIAGGRLTNKEQPAPLNYLMNFKLNGGMTVSEQIGGMATLPLPGANHTLNYATNLLYNLPLGILNLEKTPVVQKREYWWPNGPSSTLTYSYRVKDNLIFELNPYSDLEITKIEAAYVFEMQTAGLDQQFINYADQGYSSIDNTPIELESFNNNKYVFRTPYVDANTFKYQRITLPLGHSVRVKIKAELAVKNSSNRQPVIFIVTYDGNVEQGDGVNAPWPAPPSPFSVNILKHFEFHSSEQLPALYGYTGGSDNVTIQTDPAVTKGGTVYSFYGWSDGSNINPRIVTNNLSVSALYKLPNKSNSSTGLSASSQRKFIHAFGHLYKVYESMNHVWLEKSTDNGSTWSIVNNAPVDDGPEAKNPSIDYVFGASPALLLTYQLKSGTGYVIKLKKFDSNCSVMYNEDVYTSVNSYSNNATPVVCGSWGLTYRRVLVSWKELTNGSTAGGIYVRGYDDNTYNVVSKGAASKILGSDDLSFNPTLNTIKEEKNEPTQTFHLAWQQNITGGSKIKYTQVFITASYLSFWGTAEDASGTVYPNNTLPSMIVLPDNTPRLTWVGEDPEIVISRTLMRGRTATSWPTTIWEFGSNVKNCVINYKQKVDDGNPLGYIIGWTESNGTYNKYIRNTSFTNIRNFGITGKDLQVNNSGEDTFWDDMFGITLSQTSPFSFNKSAAVSSLGKETTLAANSTRKGGIYNDSTAIYFIIGNLTVDGQPVDFKELCEDADIKDLETFSSYLTSKPFMLNDQSEFSYQIGCAFYDSVKTLNWLGADKEISIKAELIDDATGQMLSSLSESKTILNIMQNNNMTEYRVSSAGIGEKLVRLRLVKDNTVEGKYLISQHYTDVTILAKENQSEEITYKGAAVVKNYDLFQNYPNPFNPATTIRYQLPKAGFVSLKIYDMIGKEVAVLADGFRQEGQYSVDFNAGNLASGLYFYELKVNDFSATKKMMLIK